LEISLFIEKNISNHGAREFIVVGDFLDNVLCAAGADSLDAFFSFYCQLAARVKRDGRTALLVVKEDLHDARKMEIVRRFADIIVEYRSREDGDAIVQEMRILNFANHAYVNWTSENLTESLKLGLGRSRPE
jgi:archaellum biogenesis ATPase FlaH